MTVAPARLLRLAVLAVLAAAAILPAAAQARPISARVAGECANDDLAPSAGNLDAIRAAVLCLHNQERARRGLAPLRENAKLRRAAEGHSADMVANSYFAHDSQSGADMTDRILRTGYVRRGGAWSLGENIAWGTGYLATPAEIHKAWLHSAGHRANILRGGYREIGIGIVTGNPARDGAASEGATYTADFGARR